MAMHRLCVRARRPTHGMVRLIGGIFSSHRLVSNISTPYRPLSDLEKQVEPLVPFTFTALTQIAHSVDEDLMERVAELGGLRSFLVSCPQTFRVAKVGDVYVARRLRKSVAFHSTVSKDVKPRPQNKEGHHSRALSCDPIRAVPDEVFKLIPSFFVPLDALLDRIRKAGSIQDGSSNSLLNAGDTGDFEDLVARFVEQCSNYIDLVLLKDTNDGGGTVQQRYVRLRPSVSRQCDDLQVFPKDEKCVAHNMESYEVAEYEQHRAARLIPIVEKFVSITRDMRDSAALLLPAGRSLIHVFVSAPHLFDVRDKPELSVRFILDPRFRPNLTLTREEIEKKLEEVNDSRGSSAMRLPINRKKRRALQRQLQFMINPLPFFDENVIAQALFDLLPIDGPISTSNLFSLLSREAHHCLPALPHRIFTKYNHMFRTVEGETELLVQRADLPLPEERNLSEISSEEIVMQLYNNFPRRRHPICGTCVERCSVGFPQSVRLRLRQLDVLNDVLRQQPDKVEVMDGLDEELLKNGVQFAQPGRLQLFRFVGIYQEELIKRYETLCLKLGRDPNKTMKLC
ncbi:uncharacterized protein TEOVI_000447300 [Trypanosoma equiperdum]|uniref:Uncharacterized protein n=2 Tax=Trypanozoon TaxID=39700 RepID=Q38DJ7_TRYB2|nr:hypothetical protein, conserved [Trypanosoma brucei brucei TREU927]EAN77123.1 hypothetical protein, conserved [Trypanosoma brucei brucei TREU927]SCU72889.1 hypothetical protein, conserved [Trypanosoma equiperdum]